METSRKKEIASAWKRIRHYCHPIETIASNAGDPVRVIEEELRPFFATLWGGDNSRFEIPEDYRHFLSFSSKGWRCDKGLGFYFYDLQRVIDSTKNGYGLFEEDDIPRQRGTWLEIGHWSDAHDVELCCDPLDSSYGSVIDCQDGHPSFSPEVCIPISKDFLSYLQGLTF